MVETLITVIVGILAYVFYTKSKKTLHFGGVKKKLDEQTKKMKERKKGYAKIIKEKNTMLKKIDTMSDAELDDYLRSRS